MELAGPRWLAAWRGLCDALRRWRGVAAPADPPDTVIVALAAPSSESLPNFSGLLGEGDVLCLRIWPRHERRA
ncbi:MAG: hypothetical protein ICV73_22140 [Acetobacteraceae bacterium]|nr:hypothetical protein [Acetobacteraceae bacterium]